MLKKINEVAERSENLENQVSTQVQTVSPPHLLACGRARGLGTLTNINLVLQRNDMIAIILPKLWPIIDEFWNLPVKRQRPLLSRWRPLWGFGSFWEKIENAWIFLEILKLWKITSYNFQSRRQFMTLGGVYCIILSLLGFLIPNLHISR